MRELTMTRQPERRFKPTPLPTFDLHRADEPTPAFGDPDDEDATAEVDCCPATPTLTALDGPLAGQQFALSSTILAGRGPYNHIVIDDVRISRQHAKIGRDASGYVVLDLKSSNGTFVNDEPVERRVLASGDILRFGPFRFRFDRDPELGAEVVRPLPRAALEVEELRLGQLEDADRKLRTLYDFVHAISGTLDQTELLDLIVSKLLEVFPRAYVAAIYIADHAAMKMIPTRVVTREGREKPEDLAPCMHIEELPRWERGMVMHVPMLHGTGVLGALHVRACEGLTLDQGDLDLLNALAVHAALTLTSARLHRESLARERLAQDLVLAERIQRSFLPISLPAIEGITFAADYEPAYSVGGDFYDVFPQGPDRIGIIVGDVSGKGVSAALLMARVSSDLRAAMLREPADPAAALDVVNMGICVRNQHDIFVTAICISIEVPTRTLTIASAGHLPPYVRRYRERDVVRVEDGASMPLGLFEDVVYRSTTTTLGPLDTLVLCTDGVIEATSERNVQFGFDGMEQSLRTAGSNPSEICDRLLAAVRAHVGAAPQYDDLTLVVCGMGGAEAGVG